MRKILGLPASNEKPKPVPFEKPKSLLFPTLLKVLPRLDSSPFASLPLSLIRRSDEEGPKMLQGIIKQAASVLMRRALQDDEPEVQSLNGMKPKREGMSLFLDDDKEDTKDDDRKGSKDDDEDDDITFIPFPRPMIPLPRPFRRGPMPPFGLPQRFPQMGPRRPMPPRPFPQPRTSQQPSAQPVMLLLHPMVPEPSAMHPMAMPHPQFMPHPFMMPPPPPFHPHPFMMPHPMMLPHPGVLPHPFMLPHPMVPEPFMPPHPMMGHPSMIPHPMMGPPMVPHPMMGPPMVPHPMMGPPMVPHPMMGPPMVPHPMMGPPMVPHPMMGPPMGPHPMMAPHPMIPHPFLPPLHAMGPPQRPQPQMSPQELAESVLIRPVIVPEYKYVPVPVEANEENGDSPFVMVYGDAQPQRPQIPNQISSRSMPAILSSLRRMQMLRELIMSRSLQMTPRDMPRPAFHPPVPPRMSQGEREAAQSIFRPIFMPMGL